MPTVGVEPTTAWGFETWPDPIDVGGDAGVGEWSRDFFSPQFVRVEPAKIRAEIRKGRPRGG